MITGEPHHNDHDEGQLLQLAVDDAIRRGDRDIERLAVRASAPVMVRIGAPVSSLLNLPALEVTSRRVLTVPTPVSYEAAIFASVDRQEYTPVGTAKTGRSWGARIDTLLPPHALQPGIHDLRVRAVLTFGGADSSRAWTETRDLPALTYALYDRDATANDARAFIFAPAATSAQALDPQLPDVPLAGWLADLLAWPEKAKGEPPDWMPGFCTERRSKPETPPREGPLCSAVAFGAAADVFWLWIRTGTVKLTDDGPEWTVEPPRVEAIITEHGTEVATLSALAALVSTARDAWPRPDTAVTPGDIALWPPAPGPGEPTRATVTVHNHGDSNVYGVEVEVTALVDPMRSLSTRRFVVDVPARGSVDVAADVVFPGGYGVILANADQVSGHSPRQIFSADPTPNDFCAFRVVNAARAPAGYVKSLGDASGCPGW